MNDDVDSKKALARARDLSEQRRGLFPLTPEEKLDAILDSPHPAALVHSFAEEDFYFLIHDIGLANSHLLLSLASDKQWEYIVDLEVWEKDRIETTSVTRWLDLLFKVDPQRFIRWFLDQKTEFMEFYLFKNIEVKIRETDQDPSDFGDEFFTLDDTFYIRFLDDPFNFDPGEHDSEMILKEQRDSFLSKFFRALADFNTVAYQKVLLESSSVIPAEVEEEAYRLRNVRLAEKGFLPHEDAIGIYQPLSVLKFEKQTRKFTTTDPGRKLFFPVPVYPAGMLGEENLFAESLKRLARDDVLEQIEAEFAGLCNLIVAADQQTVREREELRRVVKKASGYINIGLEELTKGNGEIDVNRCAGYLQQYPLDSIFKVGYGLALELKWRAEKWRKNSWFEKEGLPLSFWGEEWLGVLGGLLIKKPLFFDNYRTGLLYREFISIGDIEETENILNQIEAFDDFLSNLKIKSVSIENSLLTYKNLLLTLWARNHLDLAKDLFRLSFEEFQRIFDDLWDSEDIPRKIHLSMKTSFMNFLSDQTGLSDSEIYQRVGQTLENLFTELEEEYGEVAKKDLDARFIFLFLVDMKTR